MGAAWCLSSIAADYEWAMRSSPDAAKVHFSISRREPRNNWQSSNDVPWSAFRGITADQLDRQQTGVKFRLVRDAGTLHCDGQFYGGRGIGTFQFEPSRQFSSELVRLGYQAPDSEQQFTMAIMDVSLEFARGAHDAGAQATTKQLVEMRIHGLTLDYIREVRSLGYTQLTARDYIEMRIHGVKPDFLRYLKNAGYTVSARDAIELRIHGVNQELIEELKAAGYRVTPKEVVEMRIHGVSPAYIKELNSFGFKPSSRELVELRIHGVSTDFIRETRSLGYKFDTKELTQLRIHGVNGSYLKKLQSAGYKHLTASQIQQLRIHGID